MITNKNLFTARLSKMSIAKEASMSNPFGQQLTLNDGQSREYFKYVNGVLVEYEMSNYLIEKCVENKYTGEIARKKVNIVSLTEEEQGVVNSGVMEEITE